MPRRCSTRATRRNGCGKLSPNGIKRTPPPQNASDKRTQTVIRDDGTIEQVRPWGTPTQNATHADRPITEEDVLSAVREVKAWDGAQYSAVCARLAALERAAVDHGGRLVEAVKRWEVSAADLSGRMSTLDERARDAAAALPLVRLGALEDHAQKLSDGAWNDAQRVTHIEARVSELEARTEGMKTWVVHDAIDGHGDRITENAEKIAGALSELEELRDWFEDDEATFWKLENAQAVIDSRIGGLVARLADVEHATRKNATPKQRKVAKMAKKQR